MAAQIDPGKVERLLAPVLAEDGVDAVSCYIPDGNRELSVRQFRVPKVIAPHGIRRLIVVRDLIALDIGMVRGQEVLLDLSRRLHIAFAAIVLQLRFMQTGVIHGLSDQIRDIDEDVEIFRSELVCGILSIEMDHSKRFVPRADQRSA